MSQKAKILELFSDLQWHCPTTELYMKDDRARFSELLKKGYIFEKATCDFKECNHTSPVVMRKLVVVPQIAPKLACGATNPPQHEELVKTPPKLNFTQNQLFA